MERKRDRLENNSNDADTIHAIESSQSHTYVDPLNCIKQENLRSTKSSPHRNVELHHTRSFSEIYHLHPSSTDITCATICPRPRAIEELQHEVRRPESVLEMSDLPTSSDDESDEEDAMATQQQKGDEAMKMFLESNISIPLDGNMTSSSLSQDTLDSDVASDSELIVGNWEREWRGMSLRSPVYEVVCPSVVSFIHKPQQLFVEYSSNWNTTFEIPSLSTLR